MERKYLNALIGQKNPAFIQLLGRFRVSVAQNFDISKKIVQFIVKVTIYSSVSESFQSVA